MYFLCTVFNTASNTTVPEDAGIELRARSHPHSAGSHPHSAGSHPHSARFHPHLAKSHAQLGKISSALGQISTTLVGFTDPWIRMRKKYRRIRKIALSKTSHVFFYKAGYKVTNLVLLFLLDFQAVLMLPVPCSMFA